MRFIVMHKHDQHTEAGEPPPPELVERMGEFIGAHAQSGAFLDGNGLGASATRTRVRFKGGDTTVRHGPYTGEHELVGEVWLLTVKTRDEAIGWAQRIARILGDGEIEIGPVTEPWDLGMMPRPEDPPLRVLLLVKADATSEAGRERSPKQKADLTRLKTEMKKAGVLVASDALAPSSRSKRLFFDKNALRVVDGPFTESKELIGGYAVMRMASIDEVIEMCKEYAEILGGTLEIDLHPMIDEEEPATRPG